MKKHKVFGKQTTVIAMGRVLGLNRQTLYLKMWKGFSLEEAVLFYVFKVERSKI